MTGVNITPIGLFTGVFDGDGHTISNLTFDSAVGLVGLFRFIGYEDYGVPGIVKNLHLETFPSPAGLGVGRSPVCFLWGKFLIVRQRVAYTGIGEILITRFVPVALPEASALTVRFINAGRPCSVSAAYVQGVQNAYVADLSDRNYGTVSDCYSLGSVSGEYAGGLLAYCIIHHILTPASVIVTVPGMSSKAVVCRGVCRAVLERDVYGLFLGYGNRWDDRCNW